MLTPQSLPSRPRQLTEQPGYRNMSTWRHSRMFSELRSNLGASWPAGLGSLSIGSTPISSTANSGSIYMLAPLRVSQTRTPSHHHHSGITPEIAPASPQQERKNGSGHRWLGYSWTCIPTQPTPPKSFGALGRPDGIRAQNLASKKLRELTICGLTSEDWRCRVHRPRQGLRSTSSLLAVEPPSS
jgi:hypothetical protein